MILINNILILFALTVFSSTESHKELNAKIEKPVVATETVEIPEELLSTLENEPGIEASDLPG